MKPTQLVFTINNTMNMESDFTNKLEPKIQNNGLLPEELRLIESRREEMVQQIEEIILKDYLDPDTASLSYELNCFPDRAIMTGNYYISKFYYEKENSIFNIIVTVNLTSYELGKEDDYLFIDFQAYLDSLEKEFQLDILGSGVA